MWKFKASKFKNAVPRIPKREDWISEISAANLLHSSGSHVCASAVYMVFSTDSGGGGRLGILPLDTKGRQTPGSIPHIDAHPDFVTDHAFCPHNDYQLATCSQDGTVKLWQLPPKEELPVTLSDVAVTVMRGNQRVDLLAWHPSAQGLLAAVSGSQVAVVDVETQEQLTTCSQFPDQIQSLSWREDGSTYIVSNKAKKLFIVDPRTNSFVAEVAGHSNMRDSQVKWLGNKDFIISSGFDSMRSREIHLRDCRNLSSPVATKSFDTAAGVLIPLYDEDTGMLITAGKGDTSLRYMEVSNTDFTENSTDTIEQIKGLGLIPKRALDIMQCEVNRVLVLGKHALIPLPYHVPRKSYREFHDDLYPATPSGVAAITKQQWLDGENALMTKTNLNPDTKPGLIVDGKQSLRKLQPETQTSQPQTAVPGASQPPVKAHGAHSTQPPPAASQPESAPYAPEAPKPSVLLREKKKPIFAGVRQSKYRHVEGKSAHKSQNIENIRNLCSTIPGESDMFQANPKFCLVPLGGSGGLLTVFDVDKPRRLDDTGVFAIQNGSLLADFVCDPFDNRRLATACDDAKIRVWTVPEEGLTETLTEPDLKLLGHTEKIYFIRYHPLASGVLASGSYDMTVRIWDVAEEEERIQLQGHTDTIFCFAWSIDGNYCATVCKDGFLRMYHPQHSSDPIKQGPGPEGSRGARVVWVCNDQLLIVTGFMKGSERQLLVYKAEDLTEPVHVEIMDTSPAILIPHFDEDSSTLFLTGRGERMVRMFEVALDAPYLFPLSDYIGETSHQALAFLPKNQCDVTKVEFSKGLKLTSNSVEPVAFTVPRLKMEYFQDDLFSDTKVTWEPMLSAEEWFSGQECKPRRVSVRPRDMKLLSEAPVDAPKPNKYESFNPNTYKTDEEKRDQLLGAMMGKFEISESPLPQDLTEGVEEDEWDDY